jgi:hypothetical protein
MCVESLLGSRLESRKIASIQRKSTLGLHVNIDTSDVQNGHHGTEDIRMVKNGVSDTLLGLVTSSVGLLDSLNNAGGHELVAKPLSKGRLCKLIIFLVCPLATHLSVKELAKLLLRTEIHYCSGREIDKMRKIDGAWFKWANGDGKQ